MVRGRFLVAALALSATFPRAARAVENANPGAPRDGKAGRLILDAVEALVATLPLVRIVWKPPAALPQLIPIAYYAGRGGDVANPGDPAIWLNADHPELVSPRLARLTDEIPLFTELLLASVDVRPAHGPALALAALEPDERRKAAATLAGQVAVVTRYTAYPAVDDAEFARRAFAFAVLRRIADETGPPPVDRAAFERWIREFVFATAERQPPDSRVHAAWVFARDRDGAMRSSSVSARAAFAAPYVEQVAALLRP